PATARRIQSPPIDPERGRTVAAGSPRPKVGTAMVRVMRVAALVLAAGRGGRIPAGAPKGVPPRAGAAPLLDADAGPPPRAAGRPLVGPAIEALAACDAIDAIVPVLPADALDRVAPGALGPIARGKLRPAVAGGAERQDSMRAGLAALPASIELVAVHDAARA